MKTIKVEAEKVTTEYADMFQTWVQADPAVAMVVVAGVAAAVMFKLSQSSLATPFLVITIIAAAAMNIGVV